MFQSLVKKSTGKLSGAFALLVQGNEKIMSLNTLPYKSNNARQTLTTCEFSEQILIKFPI
jgi:hypothetical protein